MDIFRAALECTGANIPVAIAFVMRTEGGAVRDPGAAMLIAKNGETLGYVSGGCIDADVQAQGLAAIDENKTRRIRYGSGSKFADLKLPCGGAIDIQICPNPETAVLQNLVSDIESRQRSALSVDPSGQIHPGKNTDLDSFTYFPKLRIRIAGRGHDPRALASLAIASGIDVLLQSPDKRIFTGPNPLINTEHLTSPDNTPDVTDDKWTAFALMFHDEEWEIALLQQALCGSAFYVGAVGSRRTHTLRIGKLRQAGVAQEHIGRIHAPIGVIPSLRDASMLAISALAEIIGEYHKQVKPSVNDLNAAPQTTQRN